MLFGYRVEVEIRRLFEVRPSAFWTVVTTETSVLHFRFFLLFLKYVYFADDLLLLVVQASFGFGLMIGLSMV